MKRLCVFILIFLLSVFCFAQQNAGIKVIGRIPDAADTRLYQLQVGAFRLVQNATGAFEKLRAASLNPSYEKYGDLTRVVIKGVSACAIRPCIELIRRAGFSEVLIKLDSPSVAAARQPPAAARPSAGRQSSERFQDDSSEDSYMDEDEESQYNDSEYVFPKTGLWKFTGRDAKGDEWKADIVIENVRNNNFDGYFDWYMDSDPRGKEYFTGRFDTISEKVFFRGTRLVNGKDLTLGNYEAYVSIQRDQFYNGRWNEPDGVPRSDWQATWEEGSGK
jgi:hypothetical protein